MITRDIYYIYMHINVSYVYICSSTNIYLYIEIKRNLINKVVILGWNISVHNFVFSHWQKYFIFPRAENHKKKSL